MMKNESFLNHFVTYWVNVQTSKVTPKEIYTEINSSFPKTSPGISKSQSVALLITANPSIKINRATNNWWDRACEVKPDKILIIDAKDWSFMYDSLNDLVQFALRPEKQLLLLTPYLKPPKIKKRKDGIVTSFLCDYSIFQDLIHTRLIDSQQQLTFEALSQVMQPGCEVEELLVKQLPLDNGTSVKLPTMSNPQKSQIDAALVIPHRGSLEHVETCIRYSDLNSTVPKKIGVCFDEPVTNSHAKLSQRFPHVEFFFTQPYPVGPYVFRQFFAASSHMPYIIFQDSDDVPTTDRFQKLNESIQGTDSDILGSHEINLDTYLKAVTVIRYPLDPYHALNIEPAAALFLPSTMITKKILEQTGGFSTTRRFSGDLQFLWRAYFYTKKFLNLDEFLYIRRKHECSLTTDCETSLDSPSRLALAQKWRNDFLDVRNNSLKIESSSLAAERHPDSVQIMPIKLTQEKV